MWEIDKKKQLRFNEICEIIKYGMLQKFTEYRGMVKIYQQPL